MGVPPERPRKPPQADRPAEGGATPETTSGIRAMLEEAIAAEAAEDADEGAAKVDAEADTDSEHTQRVAGDVVADLEARARASSAVAEPALGSPTPGSGPREIMDDDDETTTLAAPNPALMRALMGRPRPVPVAKSVSNVPAGKIGAPAAKSLPPAPAAKSLPPAPAAKKSLPPAPVAKALPAAPVAPRITWKPPLPALGPLPAGPGEEERTEPGAPLIPPPLVTFGRYEVVRRLAYGGMAEVFLAREQTIVGATRLVAIKRMLPHVSDDRQFVSMFLDESRVALQLQHPNVCTCYEVGNENGSPFLVMEYIEGRSLAQVVEIARLAGGLAPEIAVRIIAQVAEGLHYAHRARDSAGVPLHVVHRDVSPSNIIIGRDGQVKLLDFGVAKARSHATKTRSGTVKGKFAYMAPEQCRSGDVDGRADVFALGVCLYEALTRKPLYQRDSEYATMTAVLNDPPPSVRAVDARLPEELDSIVRCALAKAAEDRFSSALDMQTALESWLAKTGTFVNAARVATSIDRLADRARDPVNALLDGLAQDEGPLDAGAARPAAQVSEDGPTARARATPRPAALPESVPVPVPDAAPASALPVEPFAHPPPVQHTPARAVTTQRMEPVQAPRPIPVWLPAAVVGVSALAAIAVGAIWLLLH